MPIWLRKFTYKNIEKFYKDKAERIEEQNNIVSNTTNPQKIAKPPQSNNTYNTKVSSK